MTIPITRTTRAAHLTDARIEHRRHVVALTAAGAALLATASGWTPNSATAIAIAVAAVAIGMPHGALDIVIGPRVTTGSLFFGGYLAAAAATVAIWLVAPVLGLVAFFVTSWFHFARGDAAHHHRLSAAGGLSGMSTAGCAIGLPLVLHSETVTPVVADLLLGTTAPTSAQVAALGAMIAYPSAVAGLVAAAAALQIRRYADVVELVAIALLAAVAHPLVSFALYFALWHAPRHLIGLDIDRRAWRRTASATAATLLAAVLVWRSFEPSAAAAARVVFIGLAALTAPHVVITELFRSRRPPGSRRLWDTPQAD